MVFDYIWKDILISELMYTLPYIIKPAFIAGLIIYSYFLAEREGFEPPEV